MKSGNEMKNIRLVTLDDGKLIVNEDFVEILEASGLSSFRAIMEYSGGTIVKQALKERYTTRISLKGKYGTSDFFLKRYLKPPVREYFKQIVRFTRPIIGAKNEWEALIFLNNRGIPTAVPVAYGERGKNSFTMTLAIEGTTRVCDWLENSSSSQSDAIKRLRSKLVTELARIVKKMHDCGINHQDLYLCHFLIRFQNENPEVFIIDNQRVMIHRGKLPERWLIKDLAQFCFSASCLHKNELEHFFEEYGIHQNKRLLNKIFRKRDRIMRHTEKNRL